MWYNCSNIYNSFTSFINIRSNIMKYKTGNNLLNFLLRLTLITIFCLSFFSYISDSHAASSRKKTFKSRITCSVCHKNILSGERYLKSNGKYFCSKKCHEKSLPKCIICGKKMSNWITSKGKKYCSEKCFNKTLPTCNICHKTVKEGFRIKDSDKGLLFFCKKCAKKAKCFSCQLPGADITLADKRTICKRCNKTAINDKNEAKKVYEKVKKLMQNHFNLKTNDKIKIALIDITAMYSLSSKNKKPTKKSIPETGLELGLYTVNKTYKDSTRTKFSLSKGFYEETTSKLTHESYNIYALYATPHNKLVEVFAHELAHDYFYREFPDIKNIKIKEGFSEYIASLVNSYYKLDKCNQRMAENTDPIYGEGYRMIKAIADKKNGLKGVLAELKKMNKKAKKNEDF